MKNKTKFLLALSLIAMLAVLFAISVSATAPVKTWDISATSSDSVTAYLYNDPNNSGMYTLTISGTGNMKDWSLNLAQAAPWYSSYNSKIISVTIEDEVTSIGDAAFYCFTSLVSVVIPDSVTSISDYMFYKCASLTNVTIPDSVTSIGYCAFINCTSLSSVTIPNNVTSIGSSAFSGCTGLSNVTIPNNVMSIGSSAFRGCTSLVSITVKESNTSYKSLDGNLYSYDGKILIQYAIGRIESSFEFPEGVTSIGNSAFSNCSNLTSIAIPEGVTSIGNSAFANCSNLTSIVIPEGVTSIGDKTFYYCNSLTIYCELESQPSGWSSSWNSSNRPVVWDYKNTIQSEIFTFKGYSFNEAGSIAIGFDIDYEVIRLYEELTGKTLEYGAMFADYMALDGKQPHEVEEKIVFGLNDYNYLQYDFVVSDLTEEYYDYQMVIAAYIYDGEVTKYVQANGLSDTVTGVTYNEAKGA